MIDRAVYLSDLDIGGTRTYIGREVGGGWLRVWMDDAGIDAHRQQVINWRGGKMWVRDVAAHTGVAWRHTTETKNSMTNHTEITFATKRNNRAYLVYTKERLKQGLSSFLWISKLHLLHLQSRCFNYHSSSSFCLHIFTRKISVIVNGTHREY